MAQDFRFDGEPLPLQLQNGIRKPAGLEAALAFTTVYTPAGGRPPYEDAVGSDGLPRYKWRGTDPGHHDNRALRTAMLQHKPLVWFVGVGDASYVAWRPATCPCRRGGPMPSASPECGCTSRSSAPAGGEPVVPNGVSMCKIHHAAFDAGIFGVDPDGVRVEVRADVLSEIDGPSSTPTASCWASGSPPSAPGPPEL